MPSSLAERYQRILDQPLDYVHAGRLQLPLAIDLPAVHAALNPFIVQGLPAEHGTPVFQQNGEVLIHHWRVLPRVARLLGAYLQLGFLARGAALRELDASQRAFAACELGERSATPVHSELLLQERLAALGLNTLLDWRGSLPDALIERLLLQFSPDVVALQSQIPAQRPRPSLIVLAVQHARFYPHPR